MEKRDLASVLIKVAGGQNEQILARSSIRMMDVGAIAGIPESLVG